jgi:hypothetical protein
MQNATEKTRGDFATIKKEIDDLNSRISQLNHPDSRRELLRRMRVLLQELTDAANSLEWGKPELERSAGRRETALQLGSTPDSHRIRRTYSPIARSS